MKRKKSRLGAPIVARATISDAIGSAASKEDLVERNRYQEGHVRKNDTGTMWTVAFSLFHADPRGARRRKRKQVQFSPVRRADGTEVTKREAKRLARLYLDQVNSANFALSSGVKNTTLDAFISTTWVPHHLSQYKPSTQATMRSQTKRIREALGHKDLRDIDAGDIQRYIAGLAAQEYNPKTIRNEWITIRLIFGAALAQGYVDSLPTKPKLPRPIRKRARHFLDQEVGRIIAVSIDDLRVFYWLAAETGFRAGELAGLRLCDVTLTTVSVDQSVWNGKFGAPKTQGSVRTLAISPQLYELLSEQIERQRAKGHNLLFSTSTGKPLDMNLLRKRKLQPLLALLGIERAGFHAFRHFNASLLNRLRIPLKTIDERQGRTCSTSLSHTVYTHSEWEQNVEAANLAGAAIEKAVNLGGLTTVKEKRLPAGGPKALDA